MRVTMHSGSGKGNIKHNDHNKTKRDDGHINYELTKFNIIMTCMDDESQEIKYTAEEGERLYYIHEFTPALEKQNKKYLAKGQKARVRNMDQYMVAKQHCPVETILQIGDVEDGVSAEELFEAIEEFLTWKQERYEDNLDLVSVSLHVDEPGHAPHVHVREVWYSHDREGMKQPGIKNALREAGVPLPDESKPEGKDNYRKTVVDAECRKKWQEICINLGFDIETEPDKTRTFGHLNRKDWKAHMDAKERLDERAVAVRTRELEVALREKALNRRSAELDKREQEIKELQKTTEMEHNVMLREMDELAKEKVETKEKVANLRLYSDLIDDCKHTVEALKTLYETNKAIVNKNTVKMAEKAEKPFVDAYKAMELDVEIKPVSSNPFTLDNIKASVNIKENAKNVPLEEKVAKLKSVINDESAKQRLVNQKNLERMNAEMQELLNNSVDFEFGRR